MYFDRITDFIFRSEKPEKADMIFIPGSGYGELAQKAAQLYQEGYAKKIVVSGKYSILQSRFQGAVSPARYQNLLFETESDFLKQVLLDCQVRRGISFRKNVQPLLTRMRSIFGCYWNKWKKPYRRRFCWYARHFMEQGLECIFKVYFQMRRSWYVRQRHRESTGKTGINRNTVSVSFVGK